ncbi:MAG TPA: cation:proton antiporter [Gemmatimonadales bacterium]|nr:cation:proton antiporter [Gemmatimonadales bacterium]
MLPRYSIASLFALGLMMALFHRVTAAGPLEARATLALGFLLLAALLGGDLAQRARLPRLTGYVLVGLAVGPAWLGLVRRDEVEALQFIEDAAVALIALAAGLEIKLAALREGRVALARAAGGAIVFPFLAITLVVLSVGRWFPLTVHQPVGDVVAVAAALGTLAAASSPAVVVAMINELDARGPLARTLLTVTVMKDVAVALLFTLVLMLLRVLTSAGALNLAVAAGALLGLTVAVAVGGLLGFALGRYLKLVRRDTALLLVAAAFLTAALGRLAHLDGILVALAAGFYLENFSTVESERLRHELQRGSLPVVVAFFAVTGAGLRVGVLQELWPWVLLLVGLRAVSLRVGLRWAGRDPRVAPALAREGWLGLLSQSGLALGLAQVARRAFPEWGVSLEALVIAMIGVHEIVGPICFRLALARAGELTGGRADVERPGDLAGGTVVAARGGL